MKITTISKLFTFILLSMFIQQSTFSADTARMSLPEGAKIRLGKGSINEIAYSPSNKHLAVAGSIGIWLYDMTTFQGVALLTGHTGNVTSLAYSLDGNTIVSGSRDGTVRLWNVTTGENQQMSVEIDWVNTVAYSPYRTTIASAGGGWEGSNPGIHLWNAHTGELIRTFGPRAHDTLCLAFSPDGNTILCGNEEYGDNPLYLWNVHTGKLIRTFNGHTGDVNGLAFSPDGKTIVSAGVKHDPETWRKEIGGEILMWNTHTGELLNSLRGHTQSVNSVIFSPDGKTLMSAGGDGIRLWDAHTGELVNTFVSHSENAVFSTDGTKIVSSGRESIRILDVQTGKLLKTILSYTDFVKSVCFSSDGKTLISGSTDNNIRLWDVHTGKLIKTLTKHTDSVNSVVLSPDGKTIASGSSDDTIRLWDLNTGKDIRILSGHSLSVNNVAFSPDGKMIGSGSSDDTIRLWNSSTGKHLKTLIGHKASAYNSVTSVIFSPDGNTLVSGSRDETIRVWNVHTGKHLYTLGKPLAYGRFQAWVNSVAISPDGNTIVSGNGGWGVEITSVGGAIMLWDTRIGQVRKTLTRHSGIPGRIVNCVAFSSDGKTVVSSGQNYDGLGEEIRLWDSLTGEHQKTFTGHTGGVFSLVFSPDGKTLASGSDDGTVLLWDFSSIE